MSNLEERSKIKSNNPKSGEKKSGVRPIPKTSRVLLFLIGMNVAIAFAPRIGLIHDFYSVSPILAFALTIGGIAASIWAFSTMYYIPGQKDS
jgi:hypothetical protein